MKRSITIGLAMLAGGAIGAVAVNGLHAQGKAPGAYAVVDISAITNPDLFKTLLPKAGSTNDAFGGKYVIRTENIVGAVGTPPKRFVVSLRQHGQSESLERLSGATGGRRDSRKIDELA